MSWTILSLLLNVVKLWLVSKPASNPKDVCHCHVSSKPEMRPDVLWSPPAVPLWSIEIQISLGKKLRCETKKHLLQLCVWQNTLQGNVRQWQESPQLVARHWSEEKYKSERCQTDQWRCQNKAPFHYVAQELLLIVVKCCFRFFWSRWWAMLAV